MILASTFWESLWGSDGSSLLPAQMMTRAVVTFLLALLIIRIAGLRSFGSKSAFDIVVSITVGAVLSNCITGRYPYWSCIAGATVLALMHRLIALLVMYNSHLAHWIKGKPHRLVKHHRIIWKNMKRHHISREDLMQSLHKNGFAGLGEIEEAIFETDGKITLIPRKRRGSLKRVSGEPPHV